MTFILSQSQSTSVLTDKGRLHAADTRPSTETEYLLPERASKSGPFSYFGDPGIADCLLLPHGAIDLHRVKSMRESLKYVHVPFLCDNPQEVYTRLCLTRCTAKKMIVALTILCCLVRH